MRYPDPLFLGQAFSYVSAGNNTNTKHQGEFMGLLSFFTSKNESTAKADIIKNIDIMAAINAHLKWKVRLDKYVNGTSDEQLDPQLICMDDQCVLGKWIHGPAKEYFMDDPKFKILLEDHAKFHMVAAQVVNLVLQDNVANAHSVLRGSYLKASRQVVKDLTDIGKQFHADKAA